MTRTANQVSRQTLESLSRLHKLEPGQTYSLRYRAGDRIRRIVGRVLSLHTARDQAFVTLSDSDQKRRVVRLDAVVSAHRRPKAARRATPTRDRSPP